MRSGLAGRCTKAARLDGSRVVAGARRCRVGGGRKKSRPRHRSRDGLKGRNAWDPGTHRPAAEVKERPSLGEVWIRLEASFHRAKAKSNDARPLSREKKKGRGFDTAPLIQQVRTRRSGR